MVSPAHILTLAAAVSGLALPGVLSGGLRKKSDPKFLQMDFNVSRSLSSTDSKKRGEATASLTNSRDIRYLMDIELGSNKQKITVALDTGSSDLWVTQSSYDTATSNSFKYNGDSFHIYYNDGTEAQGLMGTDTIVLNDGTWVSNFEFAVVNDTDSLPPYPYLGISRRVQEASSKQYDNFPYALVDAGIIEKPSYSLYLNGEEGETGSVLFGGIDTAKYEGDLVSFPIVDNYYASIELESIIMNGKTYQLNRHAQFDTGTSWLYLPQDIVLEIATLLGADTCVDDCPNGDRVVPCDQPTDQFITFDFGQQQIKLSYADFVVRPFTDRCLLGITIAEEGTNANNLIMGDVIMRHTYTYLDFENSVIAIAPSVDTSDSNIIQA